MIINSLLFIDNNFVILKSTFMSDFTHLSFNKIFFVFIKKELKVAFALI